jgi:hypothetical protein
MGRADGKEGGLKVTVPNGFVSENKSYVELWTATLQRWGDGSDDFALPIPLEVQRQLGLTENSVLNVEVVGGRLFVSHIRRTEPSNVGANRP